MHQLEGGDSTVMLVNKDGRLTAVKTARYVPTTTKSGNTVPSYNDSGDMVWIEENGNGRGLTNIH